MAKAAIAKTQSALGRYERLKRETEAEAASMTPKRKKTTGEKVTGALIQGKRNIVEGYKGTAQALKSRFRGMGMRKALERKKETKRRSRSFGSALGRSAAYHRRMNELSRKKGTITLEDFAQAIYGKEGLEARAQTAARRKAVGGRVERKMPGQRRSRRVQMK